MSVKTSSLATGTFSNTLTVDTDLAYTVQAVKSSGAGSIHMVEIDNTGNVGTTTAPQHFYLKLYDQGVAPDSADGAEYTLPCPDGQKRQYVCLDGTEFYAGLWMRGVIETGTNLSPVAGGTDGTTSPTNDVTVRITYSV